MKETAADAEKEAEAWVWKEGGTEGEGRCGEQFSTDRSFLDIICTCMLTHLRHLPNFLKEITKYDIISFYP